MRPVEALYENGLLRPAKPLNLRPGERVGVIVVRQADPSRWDLVRLAALVHGPWRGTIANDAATYASTIGMSGTLQFVDVTTTPHFAPDPELEHPFVQEWRTGVSIKRMMDWQLAFSHSV